MVSMTEDDLAIFEFTRDGQRFEIFEEGYVRVTASDLPHDAAVIINRIPQRIMEAETRQRMWADMDAGSFKLSDLS